SYFFIQAEDGIRDRNVTGVQTCALPIYAEETKDVPEATSEDIKWADAIIFSVPTRFGNLPSQMKQFLDVQGGTWMSGATVNKVVSAMSSAGNAHGGHEATILSLYT